MRILVVSDIHSNLAAFDAVLKDAGRCNAALSAGDIVGYGPNPEECVDRLYIQGFRCALGNHDNAVTIQETDWFNDDAQEAIRINRRQLSAASLMWLGSLPLKLRTELEGLKIAVYHGSPTEPLTSYIQPRDAERLADRFLAQTDADVIILGHTHIPYTIKRRGKLLLNPGSVGQPRDGDSRASYTILDTDPLHAENHRIEYNIDATAEAIYSTGLPHSFAARLYRGT